MTEISERQLVFPARTAPEPLRGANAPERIVRHYSDAGPDYAAWSPGFHMHFGYFRAGLNPLSREPMLEEMTRQVVARLGLAVGDPARVIDLGCGLGASARLAARLHPHLRVDGITLVPWQVGKARELSRPHGLGRRLRFLQGDFTSAPYRSATFDGAFAIESACHADGVAKEGFVREAARLLRPGARLVLADGFLKHDGPMSPLLGRSIRTVCDHWALDTFAVLGSFREALGRHGFEAPRTEEISWRVAFSAAQIPWVTLRFLVAQLRHGLQLNATRWRHLAACMLAPIVGMARRHFGYYLVTARRA